MATTVQQQTNGRTEAADTIANNYKNATSADQVSAASVQDAISNAPPPQQQPQVPQTQGG